MSRHLLCIGRSRQMHAKAHRLGLRLSVVAELSRVRTQRDLSMYERIVALPDTAGVAEWVAAARMVHEHDPVDAIGGFNEETQEYAAVIAGALGLPYHALETVRATRNKHLMRDALRKAGVDPTPAREIGGRDDVTAFAAEHGYPLVVKPVDGSGSAAVTVVRSAADVPARLPEGYRMLAEGFLDGREYSVEALSEKGEHRVVCVTQKFTDEATRVETGHCVPAPVDDGMRAAVDAFVPRVLDALGVTDGPTHTEVIATAGGLRVVETHLRLGGDHIVELVELALGLDLDTAWVRQVAGEPVVPGLFTEAFRAAAITFATPAATGVLERTEGTEEAAAMPGVVTVEQLREPGATFGAPLTSQGRAACVIATGATSEEAVERSRAAAGKLRFVVACAG
ncbi:ATP-grasp domain-containing protein [Streptomyces sp. URMC 124]|uniref:ATP-grasp domain-containing protein n=1 Tax=Streptomyces sp. URMC 124 TaxID=3423405 RepID=UPI003F1A5ED0